MAIASDQYIWVTHNYVARLNRFPEAVDALILVMRKGIAEGRVPPRVTMAKVVPQLRAVATVRSAAG